MAAKKSKSGRVLEGPRTLTMIGFYAETPTSEYTGWQIKGAPLLKQQGNGWTAVPNTKSLYFETYMDLSGYELDDLTFFPAEAGFQDPGLYNGSKADENIWVMDLMCQQRLPANTISTMLTDTLNEYNNAPAMMSSDVAFSELTMGNLRIFGSTLQTTSTTKTPFIVQSASAFGSGEPIVSQKLWCYRFVFYDAREEDSLTIPASRFVLVGAAAKEDSLIYINRLKNTYENQGSVN